MPGDLLTSGVLLLGAVDLLLDVCHLWVGSTWRLTARKLCQWVSRPDIEKMVNAVEVAIPPPKKDVVTIDHGARRMR